MLFTDIHSLCVEIETDDGYKDMEERKEYYDFSEYPKDHFLYSTENQAVVGKFKDEMEYYCIISVNEIFLNVLYYSPSTGISSAKKLYGKVKQRGITFQQGKDCISKQETHQLFKKKTKN